MIVPPWSLLVRRAATLFAVLALLQALLPGWHRLDHVVAPVVAAEVVVASHVGHGCGHQHADDLPADRHADDLPDDNDGDDGDHHDCPLCLALQAGAHAHPAAPSPTVSPAGPASERLAAPNILRISDRAARWTPPARGPPRRS